MTKGRVLLGVVATLATAYYVVGLLIIHLYREVLLFHLGWTIALGVLWYRAIKPSRRIFPNLATVLVMSGCLHVADWNLSYECRRTREEVDRIATERLGAPPGDIDTPRDPHYDLWFKSESCQDWNALAEVRSIMVAKAPGWCKATGILARRASIQMPRIVNWTADRSFFLCGYPYNRGFLPFPGLAHLKARLRIERQLVASAEPVRERLLEVPR